MKLSKEQKEAVQEIYGQNMIIACPGSGKTTVIIERCKEMIKQGITADKMLNITFTKAAAQEMESRFKRECSTKVEFSTIHSFCYRILAQEMGYGPGNILKESEKYVFIANRLVEIKKDSSGSGDIEEMAKNIMQGISYVKNKEMHYTAYYPDFCEKAVFSTIYKSYEEYKEYIGKIDFDDMLILTRNLFKTSEDVLNKYRRKYEFITVDEFQDVNRIQAEICYLLAGNNGNIFIVGDDDQSIYKFRAADSGIMLAFKNSFPKANIRYLNINYRSGKEIVKRAEKLISFNQERFSKDFISFREDEGSVRTVKCKDSINQTNAVFEEIESQHKQGVEYECFAILYRNNNMAIPIISKLVQKDIPFYTSETPKNHHDFIYEDIMAYWRLSRNQQIKGDLQRILNRPSRYLKAENFKTAEPTIQSMFKCTEGLKNTDNAKINVLEFLNNLKILSKKTKPVDFINYLVNEMNYKKWLESYSEYKGKTADEDLEILDILINEAKEFETMEDWMVFVKYYEEKIKEKKKNKEKKGICLSTFHSSKGLEWDSVFIINANDGSTPFAKAETVEELEEERRMFYVAATRAKNNLYISYIENRKSSPSQYLYEMGFKNSFWK